MLAGRRVVLGVTGGIAAYKAIELCRRLVDAGAHVVPVMTAGAQRFVGATTLSALASEPVQSSLWSEADPIPHTRLGQNAELIVVAPATARFLSAYATGYSHDLLTATLLATRAPVVVCPAMHTEMWEHPAVQENLATLRRRGVIVVEPDSGRLAGGDVGHGRLAAPERIVAAISEVFAATDAPGGQAGGALRGMSVLVTAGGTREPIDAVRFIGNRSSGKQGYAIAAEAAARGAEVTLVTTSNLAVPPGVSVERVETAAEMHAACERIAPTADIVVMAAAVADFRPAAAVDHKLKKADGTPQIVLEPTPDILASLGASKPAGQTLVGFAAETSELRANAGLKLVAKGADIIVANDVSAPGVGFEHDTNAVLILTASGRDLSLGLGEKREIAAALLDLIVEERSGTAEPARPTENSTPTGA